LFDEGCYFIIIEVDRAVLCGLWPFDNGQRRRCVGVGFENGFDDPVVDDLIAVNEEKWVGWSVSGLQEGVAAAKLVCLGMVFDRDAPVSRSEMRPNAICVVAHHEMELIDSGFDEGIKHVFENGSGSGRKHRFGPICGQRAKSGPLASRQDDRRRRARRVLGSLV